MCILAPDPAAQRSPVLRPAPSRAAGHAESLSAREELEWLLPLRTMSGE